jgi:hypothetical protein
MARHSCGSRSRSGSVKGEGKQRTKGKGKGKGGTRSRSRSAKGGGKQRTTGKGKGKDEEPRNVAQLQRHQLVRFIITDLTPWTEADYVEAATSLWDLDAMLLVFALQGRIGCAERMDEWLEDRRDGLLGNRLVLENDDSPGD